MRIIGVRKAIAAAAVAVTLAAGAVAVDAGSASAVWASVLCKGYASCESLGMSTHGYAAHSGTEYWRMIAGHNCTNYDAYMVMLAGGPSTRPWKDGTARAWGGANKKITDHTPAVGAVAWWDANKNGAGASGHVAYVEAVLDDGDIVVSEDNYGGDFYWKVIHTGDTSWPTGFIHFADVGGTGHVPVFNAAPTSAPTYYLDSRGRIPTDPAHVKPGTAVWARVSLLDTGKATWSSMSLVASRSSDLGSTWTGTTAATLAGPVAIGDSTSVLVPLVMPATAVDGVDHSVSLSLQSAAGTPVPHSTVTLTLHTDSRDWFSSTPTPAVAGLARQNQVLTAVTGAWDPAAALAFQWYRDGVAITGATKATYRTTGADVAHRLSVSVAGSNPHYIPAARTSTQTVTVKSAYAATLAAGSKLPVGAQLASASGRYGLVVRTTGALAIIDRLSGKYVWSTARVGARSIGLTKAGNLVAYNGHGTVVWKSGTAHVGVARAALVSSGKVLLQNTAGRTKWNSAAHPLHH